MLLAIPREKLYWEEATFAENKFQALTIKNKIVQKIKEVNANFIKDLDALELELGKIRKDYKAGVEELTAEPAETNEEKIAQKKAQKDLEEKLDEQFLKKCDEMGFNYRVYGNMYAIVGRKDEKLVKKVEFELDKKNKQDIFILEQFDKNLFSLPFSDELISSIYDYFAK